MEPLITKEIVRLYRDIAKNASESKVKSFIHDAEILDLKPMLGSKLYNDLVMNLTNENYQILMNGGFYEYNGETHSFSGLERVLSLLTYSRYILFGSAQDTGFGLVQKNNMDSTGISNIDKKTMYNQERIAAIAYFDEIKLFLNRNKTLYPYYSQDCGKTRTGFRISKIG